MGAGIRRLWLSLDRSLLIPFYSREGLFPGDRHRGQRRPGRNTTRLGTRGIGHSGVRAGPARPGGRRARERGRVMHRDITGGRRRAHVQDGHRVSRLLPGSEWDSPIRHSRHHIGRTRVLYVGGVDAEGVVADGSVARGWSRSRSPGPRGIPPSPRRGTSAGAATRRRARQHHWCRSGRGLRYRRSSPARCRAADSRCRSR